MKSGFKRVVSTVMLVALMGTVSYGQEAAKAVLVNENKLEYTKETGQPFVSSNGIVMVPLGSTLKALGVTMEFQPDINLIKATHKDKSILIPLGKKYIELEGKKLVLPTRTRLIGDKAYGPIEPIVRGLRMTVEKDSQNSISLSEEPTYELLNLVDTVSPEDDRVELVETSYVSKPNTLKSANVASYPKVLSTFATNFNAGVKSRSTNIRVATESINGVEIGPGELFSYNDVVGSRSTSRGYVASTVISGGEYVKGVGGGVCQVSSTLFAAALDANMTIVERHPHSLAQTYLPYGKDAAVYYGSLDLKFKNPYSYPVIIESSYDSKGTINIAFRGPNEISKPNIKINIAKVRKGVYTLERTADGVKNYTVTSKYNG